MSHPDDIAAYQKNHKVCPVCKATSYETTCMGAIVFNPETHVDNNRVSCPCGWRGTVHELKPLDEGTLAATTENEL